MYFLTVDLIGPVSGLLAANKAQVDVFRRYIRVSAIGYCMSPGSLRSICAQIRVETALHTLVRSTLRQLFLLSSYITSQQFNFLSVEPQWRSYGGGSEVRGLLTPHRASFFSNAL